MIKVSNRVRIVRTGETAKVLRSFKRVGEMLDDLAVVRLDRPDWTGSSLSTFYHFELELVREEGRASA